MRRHDWVGSNILWGVGCRREEKKRGCGDQANGSRCRKLLLQGRRGKGNVESFLINMIAGAGLEKGKKRSLSKRKSTDKIVGQLVGKGRSRTSVISGWKGNAKAQNLSGIKLSRGNGEGGGKTNGR